MKTFPSRILLLAALAGLLAMSACAAPVSNTSTLAEEVILYDWTNDIPESVFEDFTKEFGVNVRYVSYESQEEAIDSMKAGEVYDIVVLDNQFIPGLIQSGMLRQITYSNIPNFKYISANFRDLVYDPGNRYSIPYNWGTTGLVVRSDLVKQPVDRWDDLWNQQEAGKVLLWKGVSRQMMGMALKSLGYSANTEDPAQLEQALEKMLALKPNSIFSEDYDSSLESSAPLLLRGEAVLAVGWSHDVMESREENPNITYVLPQEGALLWGDNFVIPTKNNSQYTAEVFLNYLLRPEVSARITNHNSYPTANEKATEFVDAALRDDPMVFPRNEDMKNAEIILPLSPEGEQRHQEIWQRFLDAP